MFVRTLIQFALVKWQRLLLFALLFVFLLPLGLMLAPNLAYADAAINATVKVINLSNPPTDPGLFNLQIDSITVVTDTGNDGNGVATVTADHFSVGETAGTGTDLTNYTTSIKCVNDLDSQPVLSGTGTFLDNIPINDQASITCTITNTRKPVLNFKKMLLPASDPGKFKLQIDSLSPTDEIGDGGSTGPQLVTVGDHALRELAGANTSLGNYNATMVCKADGGNGNAVSAALAAGDWTVNLGAGDNVLCTLTNTRKTGQLTVVKALQPTTDSGKFDLQIDGVTYSPNGGVGDGGSTSAQTVATGAHTVAELATTGTDTQLANYSTTILCKDSLNHNITATPGLGFWTVTVAELDNIVCTLTNVRKGKLTVTSVLQPAADVGRFNLKIDGTILASNVGNNGSTGAQVVLPGAYTVGESVVNGTSLENYTTNISCRDGGGIGNIVATTATAGPLNVTVNPGDEIICVVTNTVLPPQLQFSKTDGGGAVTPGGTINYTLRYTNTGGIARSTVITETVPTYATFVGPSSDWSCSPGAAAGTVCKHTVGNLALNANGSLTFGVRVDNTLPAGVTQIVNNAKIGYSGVFNVVQSNATTMVDAAPDLSITKDDGGLTPKPGDALLYTLTYANHGNQAATGVVINETMPANTTFVTNASSPGWNCSGSTCTYVIGALAAGASNSLRFAVRINDPLPVGVGQVINQATIQDDGTNGLEPTVADNKAVKNTTLKVDLGLIANKQATLAVDADNDGTVSPGDTVEYLVTLNNVGNTTLTGVTFQDTPDANTHLAPNSPVQTTQGRVTSGNTAGDTAVAISIGAIAPNAIAQIRLRVVINTPLLASVTTITNQGLVKSQELPELLTDDPAVGGANDPTVTSVATHVILHTTLTDYLLADADHDNKVSAGDILLYRLVVSNIGNTNATDLVIADTPDTHSTLLGGTVRTDRGTIVTGSSANDTAIQIQLVDGLRSGEAAIISFQVKVNKSSAISQLSTQATITAKQGDKTITALSDDPDSATANDATITPLGSFVPSPTSRIYLPLITR